MSAEKKSSRSEEQERDDEDGDRLEPEDDDGSEPDDGEADDGEADDDAADSSATTPEPSEWHEKARLAQRLWDGGNNAELARVLDDLQKAPAEERDALELARTLRKRLQPDPVAIALWLLTLGVFGLLTYLFVLR